MDRILETTESYHTRMKWAIDFKAKFPKEKPVSLLSSLMVWQGIVTILYEKMSRKEIVELVAQCRAVGLNNMASEFEQSLGSVNKKELQEMYNESQK